MARPTKLTRALQDGIVGAVQLGISLRTAADYVGVQPATVNEWMARGTGTDPQRPLTGPYAAFAAAVTRARSLDEMRRLSRLEAAARGGTVVYRKTTTHRDGRTIVEEHFAPPDWRADAFVLERSRPEQWGRKASVDLRLQIEKAAALVANELGLEAEELIAEAQRMLREIDHNN